MPDAAFDRAIPVRNHPSEDRPDGLVTVLVPKFSSRLARRFLVPLLAKPVMRVHLDVLGSAVWRACDGRTSVAELTDAVCAQSGGDAGAARRGVRAFLHTLAREGSISFAAKEPV